ncbi:prolipoprotein diacylglyceryl transferase [Helcococcus kunzii]|uniref:prolipoprotein diacylglyceryl transferase n=1 Tax=Helcococcus kunzii TaxID=40091 RepID=UPI0024AE184E|nr:prolipoprotein diacylglyceryl transferase [Helcococcus kunzii]
MFEYTGSRVAFSLFGVDVYWYGILIVTGMILAVIFSGREIKRAGGDPDLIYDIAIWILPAAIIGARLYYVIFEFDRYNSIFEMINMRDGGLAIHGGVIAGVLVGYIYTKVKKIKFMKLADIVMIFLPLAQSIGRWGNFINGEAHGGPTDSPLSVVIDGQKYHPTFFYESVGNFLIFLFLYYLYRKKSPKTGTTTALYLILYGIIRFFIEGLRTDSLWLGPIRVAQLVSVLSIIIGLIILYFANKDKFYSENFYENK